MLERDGADAAVVGRCDGGPGAEPAGRGLADQPQGMAARQRGLDRGRHAGTEVLAELVDRRTRAREALADAGKRRLAAQREREVVDARRIAGAQHELVGVARAAGEMSGSGGAHERREAEELPVERDRGVEVRDVEGHVREAADDHRGPPRFAGPWGRVAAR